MGEIINPRTGERTPVVVHVIDPIEREITAKVVIEPPAYPPPPDDRT